MPYKIGRAIKPKAQNNFTIGDYFSPNVAELLANCYYWLAINKIAPMLAFNRVGTSVCLTLYQDKGKEPLWSNTPEEFADLLFRLAEDCAKVAKEEGLV